MARQLRIQFPGAIYHLTARGNAQQNIFLDDRDRRRFIQRLAERVASYNVRLYLFCLMHNHYHLLVETPEPNVSRFMQSVETGYAVYFNLRHRRVGHVTQGRFVAKVVQGDEYLMRLSRYVHLNPVRTKSASKLTLAERIQSLNAYRWSSYRGYVGLAPELGFVDYAAVLTQVAGKSTRRQRKYREFVELALAESDEELAEALKESRRSVGGEQFRKWVDRLYLERLEGARVPEDIRFRRELGRLSPGVILDEVSRVLNASMEDFWYQKHKSWLRPLAAAMLQHYGGLNNRQIARELKLKSGAAVGWQVRKLRDDMGRSRELVKKVKSIESLLDRRRETEQGKG